MKTIAIYNHKGGVGKTVTTVNVAYNMAACGKRVLVVDMDPQGNTSSFFRRYDMNKVSVKELLTGECVPSRSIKRTRYPSLDIIPANIRLREMNATMLIGEDTTLKSALWAVENKYDYCIIDCPPSVDFLAEVIMKAANEVIVPMTPDSFSTDGLASVLDIVHEFGSADVEVGCLFTKFYRNKETIKVIQNVIQTHNVCVFDSVIRRHSAVDRSVNRHRPLMKCASKTAAALDYKEFTEELLRKEIAYGIITKPDCDK